MALQGAREHRLLLERSSSRSRSLTPEAGTLDRQEAFLKGWWKLKVVMRVETLALDPTSTASSKGERYLCLSLFRGIGNELH